MTSTRIAFQTPTIGTGAILPGNNYTGFKSITSVANNTLYYQLDDFPNWEIGSGFWNGSTLSRIPTDSSAAGGLIALSGAAITQIVSPFANHNLTINPIGISANTNYVPSPGMIFAQFELWGAGAAGGGINWVNPTSNGYAFGGAGGGGSGSYSRSIFTANQIGSAQTVTIGAAGLAVLGANGGNGGNTIFGSNLIVAAGGSGGVCSNGNGLFAEGGIGGVPGIGQYAIPGISGKQGWIMFNYPTGGIPFQGGTAPFIGISGAGANPPFGAGAAVESIAGFSGTNGNPGLNSYFYGAGGSGASFCSNVAITATGGNGFIGFCFVTEFIMA